VQQSQCSFEQLQTLASDSHKEAASAATAAIVGTAAATAVAALGRQLSSKSEGMDPAQGTDM